MTLRDIKGRTISDAQITVDGNVHVTTDKHGYFRVDIAKPSGAQAHLVIEKQGKRLFGQEVTISPGLKTLSLE